MPRTIDLDAATAALRRGGVIACATEAVWGLSCDPFDEAAVMRLLDIKRREVDKGLILVASELAQLDDLVDWPRLAPQAKRDILASWPGPNTWWSRAMLIPAAWGSRGPATAAT